MNTDFIHRFIPAADPATAPTLLLLHGTGGNEDDLLELGRSLMPSPNLLSPRGKVQENGMPRFFRRLAEGVFDEPDLILRTHELADFVTAAAGHYNFNPQSVSAAGYSNGANIAASLMLLRPEILSRAVLLRAMVPLVPEKNTRPNRQTRVPRKRPERPHPPDRKRPSPRRHVAGRRRESDIPRNRCGPPAHLPRTQCGTRLVGGGTPSPGLTIIAESGRAGLPLTTWS